MPRYRKKPVEIVAEPVTEVLEAAKGAWETLPDWIIDAYESGTLLFLNDAVSISTLEGTMRGERDDWLVRGVQGELYPVKPDIFAATYEAVDV